jgi:signal transduction histidine kinase
MALAFLVMPVAGVLDLARISGQSGLTGLYVLVYASAVSLVLVGAGLVRMFAVALRTSRDAEKVLQHRVEDRERELQAVHARVVEMERVRVRADERDRVMRDMHDGLLSSLELTRVALGSRRASPEQGARRVAECVADLRLMLEASGGEVKSLHDSIAEFRRRFDDAILDTGILPRWDVALEGMPAMPSSSVLQVMRIVQEALNNAIRHSGASELSVWSTWTPDTGTLEVRVSDNGCGMSSVNARDGRGLANMRQRARELGGALHVEGSGQGTTVRLVIPGVVRVAAGSA